MEPSQGDVTRRETSLASSLELRLGRLAVERGHLTSQRLDEALAELQSGGSGRLGELLAARGWVTPAQWAELERDLSVLLQEQPRKSSPAGVPDRYDVRDLLGEGATAVVYRAWDRQLGRTVALKVLRDAAGLSEVGRERFRREARVEARLAHPNVVTVYDAGEEGGRLYLVMELVEGRPLSGILAEGKTPLPALLRMIEKSARGVAAAHAQGIVHRDLKPGNVIVSAAGEPKVADFGLAHLSDEGLALTRTGATLGTPFYMAPEQVEGRATAISPRTDVYALGAMLYEALSGRPPQRANTLAEVYSKILHEEPAPLRAEKPGIPRDLETIVLKALEKDPAKRYASAQDLADDLRRYLGGEPVQARPIPTSVRILRKAARRRAVLLPLAALVLGAAAVLVFLWSRSKDMKRLADLQETELRQARAAWPPRLDALRGEVLRLSTGGQAPARDGEVLGLDNGLRTAGQEAAANVVYKDSARLELGPDTELERLSDRLFLLDGEGPPGKGVGMRRGRLTVDSSGQAVTVRTPDGLIRTEGGRASIVVGPRGTRLEVLRGRATLTRLADRSTREVDDGFYAATDQEGTKELRPLRPELRIPIAGFESEDLSDWGLSSAAPDSTITFARESPGIVGKGALRVDYSVAPGGWAYVSFKKFEKQPQDWSETSGVEFWFYGSKTGLKFVLEIFEGADGTPHELFVYDFLDSFSGWRHFSVPWSAFRRRSHQHPGAPDDGFTLSKIRGLNFHTAQGKGSFRLDEIEVFKR
jgi:serine/threonine-protein kinase